jgi:hypothetical protein
MEPSSDALQIVGELWGLFCEGSRKYLKRWYARADSNGRPFAPEAVRLPFAFIYLHAVSGRYLDGKPLLPGSLIDRNYLLLFRAVQMSSLHELVGERL